MCPTAGFELDLTDPKGDVRLAFALSLVTAEVTRCQQCKVATAANNSLTQAT